jgi:type I restriction enzyme S subunit
MSEWRECKLGEMIKTNVNSIAASYSFNEILYLDTGSITKGKIEELQNISIYKAPSRAKRLVKENDIIYSTVRPIQRHYGFIKKPPKNLVVSTGFAVISCNEKLINSKFLYYYLTSDSIVEELDILAEASTSTYPSLKPSDIEKLQAYFPIEIDEQKAIASVLSSLDDKIDLLHRQNKTLEAMAEMLFRQWFIEEASEDWEFVTVGDFATTNEITVNNSYDHRLIEYLDTSSLTEGKIGSVQLLSLEEAPSRAKRLVKHNDVLISIVRPNQKHFGIIKNPKKNLVVSTGFCVLTCHKIDPHFIYILLTTDEMTEYLHSIAEGSTSTYPSLKPSDIEKIEFQLPQKSKLNKFSKIASDNWNKIDSNHEKIRTLEKLRDNLLPKLMSGEVRMKLTEQDRVK